MLLSFGNSLPIFDVLVSRRKVSRRKKKKEQLNDHRLPQGSARAFRQKVSLKRCFRSSPKSGSWDQLG